MTRCASRNVAPPGTVVPTAGAMPGSRKSTSRLTCSSPSAASTRSRKARSGARDAVLVDRPHVVHDDAGLGQRRAARPDRRSGGRSCRPGRDRPARRGRGNSPRSPARPPHRPPACRADGRWSWCRACGSRDARRARARTAAARPRRRAAPRPATVPGRQAVVAAEEDRHRAVGGGRVGGLGQRLGPGGDLRQHPERRVAVAERAASAPAVTVPRSTTLWPRPSIAPCRPGGAQRARAHLAAQPPGAVLDGRADQPAEPRRLRDSCHAADQNPADRRRRDAILAD